MKRLIAILVLVLSIVPPAVADLAEQWVHRFSNVVSNAQDRAFQIALDPAGDVVIAGVSAGGISAQDMLTIKYSGANGTILWQRRYNDPSNGDDVIKALAVDRSGNVVIAGSSTTDNKTEF